MQVYFMRHGQTNFNLQQLCNDDPSQPAFLTETGKQQALQAAEVLRHAPLERIIVSQLPRTRQTAEIINQHHQVGIEISALINDIRSGFDGQPVQEYMAAIAHDRLHAGINGGESLLQHKQRVLQFIDWLKQQPNDCLLVIAHEETLRVFKAWFETLDDQTMIDLAFGNCEIINYTL